MNVIYNYGSWIALGVLLGVVGWHPLESWQWWAWMLAFTALDKLRSEK